MSNPAWDDLKPLGMRLNRLIKYSETMLKKTDKDDHDGKNRYISTIVSLTRQQLEIIKLRDNYDEINSWFAALKQDENAIKKHKLREHNKTVQQEKQEMQIEEEKSVRMQAEAMKASHEMRL